MADEQETNQPRPRQSMAAAARQIPHRIDDDSPVIARSEMASILSTAFGRRGVSPQKLSEMFLFGHLIECAAMPFVRLQYQETGGPGRADTRTPVENLVEAIETLQQNIRCVIDTARAPTASDKINVSKVVIQDLNFDLQPGPFWEQLERILNRLGQAANSAMGRGCLPTRSRPPLLIYRDFVEILARLAVDSGIGLDLRVSKSKKCSGDFIALVCECELILPQDLRAKQRATVSDRVRAAMDGSWIKVPGSST